MIETKEFIVVGLPECIEQERQREQIVHDYYPNVLCCDSINDQEEVQAAIDALSDPSKKQESKWW